MNIRSAKDAMAAGIGLVPESRREEGIFPDMSIKFNETMKVLDQFISVRGVNHRKENEIADKYTKDLRVKAPGTYALVGNLSGGNQQKVVVAKWLARNSRVVMFDEPTRGIDVAAKVEIYHLMNRLKQQGIAVMFVSSEMPEVMGIADRIIVMCDGRITGEIGSDEATQEKILTLATRFEQKIAVNQ